MGGLTQSIFTSENVVHIGVASDHTKKLHFISTALEVIEKHKPQGVEHEVKCSITYTLIKQMTVK